MRRVVILAFFISISFVNFIKKKEIYIQYSKNLRILIYYVSIQYTILKNTSFEITVLL